MLLSNSIELNTEVALKPRPAPTDIPARRHSKNVVKRMETLSTATVSSRPAQPLSSAEADLAVSMRGYRNLLPQGLSDVNFKTGCATPRGRFLALANRPLKVLRNGWFCGQIWRAALGLSLAVLAPNSGAMLRTCHLVCTTSKTER